jgi:hypothetical protein
MTEVKALRDCFAMYDYSISEQDNIGCDLDHGRIYLAPLNISFLNSECILQDLHYQSWKNQ